MAAAITKPGYWWITNGQGLAGIVKYNKTGTLKNATDAVFVGKNSVSQGLLDSAINNTKSSWVWEAPVGPTGWGTSSQPPGVLMAQTAQKTGHAFFSAKNLGIQTTTDLYALAVIVAAPVAASVAGAGAGAAAVAGAGAAGGEAATAGGAGTAAATGGGAGAVASKAASAASSGISDLSSLTGSLKGLTTIAAVVSLFADPQFWLRVIETLGGLYLIFLGIKSLTQDQGSGTQVINLGPNDPWVRIRRSVNEPPASSRPPQAGRAIRVRPARNPPSRPAGTGRLQLAPPPPSPLQRRQAAARGVRPIPPS